MKRSKDTLINSVFLVPVAIYALGAAVIPVVWPKLFRGALAEIIIWSLFLSPTIALLGIWRVWKRDSSIPILVSTVFGIIGTLFWIYGLWKKISLQ